MNYMNNRIDMENIEYKKLVEEIKQELPNIIFPSMGMFNEVDKIVINGKDFVISDEEV